MGYLDETGLGTLVGKIKGQVVELTSAEYRQIDPSVKNYDNKLYFVNDEVYTYSVDDVPTSNSNNLVKSGGVYESTSKIGSGTLTTTAQTIIPAINELKSSLTTKINTIATFYGLTLSHKQYGNVHQLTIQGTTDQQLSSGNIYDCGEFTIPNWDDYRTFIEFNNLALCKFYTYNGHGQLSVSLTVPQNSAFKGVIFYIG